MPVTDRSALGENPTREWSGRPALPKVLYDRNDHKLAWLERDQIDNPRRIVRTETGVSPLVREGGAEFGTLVFRPPAGAF